MKYLPVVVPSRKTQIHPAPGFKKKGLADYHLELSALCGFKCTYCSSNAGNFARIRGRVDDWAGAVAAAGEKLDMQDSVTSDGRAIVLTFENIIGQLERELLAVKRDFGCGNVLVVSELTDAFVPALVQPGITRRALELLLERTEFTIRILTKSAVVGKPEWVDFFAAHRDRFLVGLSITTIDDRIVETVERGTSTPSARIKAHRVLQDSGIRTYGMLCPVLPESVQHVDALLDAIRPERCEQIWAEPINHRSDKWSLDHRELQWSGYSLGLYSSIAERASRDGWIARLNYLLYEGGVAPEHAKAYLLFGGFSLQSTATKLGHSKHPQFAEMKSGVVIPGSGGGKRAVPEVTEPAAEPTECTRSGMLGEASGAPMVSHEVRPLSPDAVADHYEHHPLAALVQKMTPSQKGELLNKVREARAVLVPVTIFEDLVLDGRHRLEVRQALLEQGIVVAIRFEEYLGNDPAGFVLSRNLHERELTDAQRALGAEKLASLPQGSHPPIGGTEATFTMARAALRYGTSERQVSRARALRRAAPDLYEALDRALGGKKLTINACLLIARRFGPGKRAQFIADLDAGMPLAAALKALRATVREPTESATGCPEPPTATGPDDSMADVTGGKASAKPLKRRGGAEPEVERSGAPSPAWDQGIPIFEEIESEIEASLLQQQDQLAVEVSTHAPSHKIPENEPAEVPMPGGVANVHSSTVADREQKIRHLIEGIETLLEPEWVPPPDVVDRLAQMERVASERVRKANDLEFAQLMKTTGILIGIAHALADGIRFTKPEILQTLREKESIATSAN